MNGLQAGLIGYAALAVLAFGGGCSGGNDEVYVVRHGEIVDADDPQAVSQRAAAPAVDAPGPAAPQGPPVGKPCGEILGCATGCMSTGDMMAAFTCIPGCSDGGCAESQEAFNAVIGCMAGAAQSGGGGGMPDPSQMDQLSGQCGAELEVCQTNVCTGPPVAGGFAFPFPGGGGP